MAVAWSQRGVWWSRMGIGFVSPRSAIGHVQPAIGSGGFKFRATALPLATDPQPGLGPR